jgi:tyrosyl-tRNA synthetase
MNPEAQCEILSRGTEEILPDGELLARLRLAEREKRPLRVKQGFDPTAPDIHLGHTVGLRKLRQFQDFGHQVVLIVGDYTGMVGDPSGQSKTRPQLTEQQVNTNAQTYLDQFFRVLVRDPSPPLRPVEIHRNGEWFSKMSFMDVMKMASHYTVARMLERDDFAKRFEARQPISVHELFYPLMQGYDSVAIRSDVELGGTEQKFNLIVGRAMQELHGQLPQIVMTLPLLIGLDGVQRMSKSLGNYIGVTDAPGEMFGKIMSLPDRVMTLFWRLATDAGADELDVIERSLADPTVNPMEIKRRLGERIVTLYHGEEAAAQARADFDTQFSRKQVPENIEEYRWADVERASGLVGEPTIIEHIVGSGLAASKSAARRLVEQGAVSVVPKVGAPDRVRDVAYRPPRSEWVLRVGRKLKRFKA